MANSNFPSVAEIISALEHSDLPTVIVEGSDDIIIYRQLESQINGVDVMPVGGRNAVLEIFCEKLTNPKLQSKRIAFIADKDIWVTTGIPHEYQHDILIFTNGYSIENDVFIDYGCEKILEAEEAIIKNQFLAERDKFIQWYAMALQATLNGQNLSEERQISRGPNEVLGQKYQDFIALRPNENHPPQLEQTLKENYTLQLRGKSLLSLFRRHLKYHHSKAMFQKVAIDPKTCINRIFDDVAQQFVE